MALRLCGLVSVVFFAACVFAGKYLMLIFTNESVLIEHGVSYLRIAGSFVDRISQFIDHYEGQ